MTSCPIFSPCPLATDPSAIEVDHGVCPLCSTVFKQQNGNTPLPPTPLEIAIEEAIKKQGAQS